MPQKLPEYTYVPGLTPHPVSHPAGHWHNVQRPPLTVVDALEWGMLLFDRGYYWEAHEIWEGAWLHLGRRGARADLVKGLIKFAAAGVKILAEQPAGAQRHAARATQLLTAGMETARDWLEFAACIDAQAALGLSQQAAASPPAVTPQQRATALSGGVPLWTSIANAVGKST